MKNSTSDHRVLPYSVQSLEKALDMLELFTQHHELGTREMARLSGYNRSTVHRVLVTFLKHGYLVQNPTDGRFRLGTKLLKLGSIVGQRFDLRNDAYSVMRALAKDLNESVYLLIQESDDSVVCIEEVQIHRTLAVGSTLGVSTPIYAAAAGKCFLAEKPMETLKQLLATHELLPITERTITDAASFLVELEKVRVNGYALNDEESEMGVRYIAVPIVDHSNKMIAALNVGAPVVRLVDERIEPLVAKMKAAATVISQRTGLVAVEQAQLGR